MPTTPKRPSVLAERIAEGKADPISIEEREIVAALRADFDKKFGNKSGLVKHDLRQQSKDMSTKKS